MYPYKNINFLLFVGTKAYFFVCIVQCAVCNIQCALSSVQCAVSNIQVPSTNPLVRCAPAKGRQEVARQGQVAMKEVTRQGQVAMKEVARQGQVARQEVARQGHVARKGAARMSEGDIETKILERLEVLPESSA